MVGDVVFLKCGSPAMVIVRIQEYSPKCECVWIDDEGDEHRSYYPPEVLNLKIT